MMKVKILIIEEFFFVNFFNQYFVISQNHVGAESVFHFDGTGGAIVPNSLIRTQEFASFPFSISTMFRHKSSPSSDKHTKEHIICSADDHSKYNIFKLHSFNTITITIGINNT